jgi:PBP1b-binding outer membrane lipoprotein LpoB
MRIIYFLLITVIITGCTGKVAVKEPVKQINDNKTVDVVKQETAIQTGWSDKDTYTVSVTAPDMDKAREAAKHKILHDIVKVRMMNESRFTDITKISAEFDKPLKEGKVISQKQVNSGIQIFFQIRDEGLKEKFERK